VCRRQIALAAACTALLAPVLAQDTLTPGPGADLTQAKCTICHEIGHITRIRQSRSEWEETLRIMVTRGAPITPQEFKTITDYLAIYYGREGPPEPQRR
jgi:hypothetical protein